MRACLHNDVIRSGETPAHCAWVYFVKKLYSQPKCTRKFDRLPEALLQILLWEIISSVEFTQPFIESSPIVSKHRSDDPLVPSYIYF